MYRISPHAVASRSRSVQLAELSSIVSLSYPFGAVRDRVAGIAVVRAALGYCCWSLASSSASLQGSVNSVKWSFMQAWIRPPPG